jgi:phage baseplate assembly protein W
MNVSQPDPSKAFLGVGWAFPVGVAPDGRMAEAAYEEDVRQAIRIILGTNPDERVMRPEFGAGLKALVFEPINTTLMELVRTRVRDALVRWEPRVDLDRVDVRTDPPEPNKLLIEVWYRVRATNAVGNLVYPFYLQEGTST